MCGILGIAAFHKKEFLKRKEFIKQGIIASSLRGIDGTGMFMVPHDKTDEIKILKKPIPGYDFVGLEQTEELLKNAEHYKYIVAHNRLKTRGDIKAAHTHPFNAGPITMVHNGMISNSYALGGNKTFEVDSMAAAKVLSETKDPREALEALEGAFALVWYDERTDALFLARNEERPLFFGIDKKNEILVFASELRMLDWISSRIGIDLGDSRWDVGENQILMLTDSTRGKLLKFKKKEVKKNSWDWRDNYGKFLPKTPVDENTGISMYGPTASPYLARNGLALGEVVNFYFNEWQLKKPNSRHGTIIGTMATGKRLEVKANGIAFKSGYTQSTKLQAKIAGAHVIGADEVIILVNAPVTLVDNLLSFNKKDNLIEETIPVTSTPTQVKGPIGMLEEAEFNKLVEDGCTACQGPIFTKDSVNLRWTVDGHPVCPTCAATFHDCGALLQ